LRALAVFDAQQRAGAGKQSRRNGHILEIKYERTVVFSIGENNKLVLLTDNLVAAQH
jgi:hypothetical protein